jgi:hypothetical protein
LKTALILTTLKFGLAMSRVSLGSAQLGVQWKDYEDG